MMLIYSQPMLSAHFVCHQACWIPQNLIASLNILAHISWTSLFYHWWSLAGFVAHHCWVVNFTWRRVRGLEGKWRLIIMHHEAVQTLVSDSNMVSQKFSEKLHHVPMSLFVALSAQRMHLPFGSTQQNITLWIITQLLNSIAMQPCGQSQTENSRQWKRYGRTRKRLWEQGAQIKGRKVSLACS